MSDMLQQAIIDATALKEAAVRNAETLVLEKYSNEIKDAVETLLEQEDPAAALEPAGTDAAPAAEDQQEEAQVVEDLPLASLAEDLDEEIEIPLTNLMEELERMTGLKNLAGDLVEGLDLDSDDDGQLDIIAEELEAMLSEEDISEKDEVELEEDIDEALAALEEDLIDEALLEELLDEDEDADEGHCSEGIEEDLDQLEEGSGQKVSYRIEGEFMVATLEVGGKTFEGRIKHRNNPGTAMGKAANRARLKAKQAGVLEEALVVDIKPTKRGWAGRPDSDIELAEEELLALEQDSEHREKMAAMRKAVNNLEGVNEGLTQENETLKQQLNEVKAQMSKIRNVANTLKENIDQTNLTNAKLLYQNKALNSDSMNERQKNKLVEALNNAETVEEAKVIFDTLENTVGSTSRKSQPKSLVEAVEKSSSIVYASRKQRIAEQKQTPAYDRWKFLAGIDKN